MTKFAFLTVLLVCSAFAGNFQAKNDTIPNAEYYIDRQDSVYRAIGKKQAGRPEHNTCAWTVDCPNAKEREGKSAKREHRKGPRWIGQAVPAKNNH